MANVDSIAQTRIEELEADLDAQTTLNVLLEAELVEVREANVVLRRALELERQNRELADYLVA